MSSQSEQRPVRLLVATVRARSSQVLQSIDRVSDLLRVRRTDNLTWPLDSFLFHSAMLQLAQVSTTRHAATGFCKILSAAGKSNMPSCASFNKITVQLSSNVLTRFRHLYTLLSLQPTTFSIHLLSLHIFSQITRKCRSSRQTAAISATSPIESLVEIETVWFQTRALRAPNFLNWNRSDDFIKTPKRR